VDLHQHGFSFNHGVNTQDGVGAIGLEDGYVGGVEPIGLEHANSLEDDVGDVDLHCNATPSKSKDNLPKFGNFKLTTLDSKLMTNLNPCLSPQNVLRNTLLSKSSVLNNDH
jgi:hypothetical protein